MSACKNCGSIDQYASQGESVCSSCGAVVENSIIVSEIQFQENSSGISTVVGQFVSYEGSRSIGRDSRRSTLQNAKYRIQNIANQLNMGPNYVEMAYKLFKLALSKGLTKGRRSNHVAAACLYIICRMEKKPFMLLDFSDKLEVDVYTLGHTYVRLSSGLYISIPALDPCLYIERYAHKLEFGDKTMEVCKTANRLVSRMDRDWMVQGRRPSGICGAALLVAARIFNFNRTIKDIIKVVRIGPRTIKNRLHEFEKTPSSRLTIKEFHTINLEECMDPPCFTAGIKRAKMAEQLENRKDLSLLLEEVETLRSELEEEIQEITQRKFRKFKKYGGAEDDAGSLGLSSVAPSQDELNQELARYQHLFVKRDEDSLSYVIDVELPVNVVRGKSPNDIVTYESVETRSDSGIISPEMLPGDNDPEVGGLVSSELDDILNHNIEGVKDNRKMPEARLRPKELIEECLLQDCEIVEDDEDESNGELDLTGINDEELDEMILTEDEIKIKMVRWIRENADYLKDMKEKEEKKARELLENPNLAKKKRRPPRPRTEASTAREAVERILQSTKLSDKINYDVLMFDISSIKSTNDSKIPPVDKVDAGAEGMIETVTEIAIERNPLPVKKIKIDILEDVSSPNKKQEDASDGDDDNDNRYYFDKEENEFQQSSEIMDQVQEYDCEQSDSCYYDSD